MNINNFPFRSERDFFNTMVPADHAFRKLNKIVDFRKLAKPLRHLYSPIGEPGINAEKGIRCLIVQYWEDYSDRQMEQVVRENNAVRYFTGFKLTETTLTAATLVNFARD